MTLIENITGGGKSDDTLSNITIPYFRTIVNPSNWLQYLLIWIEQYIQPSSFSYVLRGSSGIQGF